MKSSLRLAITWFIAFALSSPAARGQERATFGVGTGRVRVDAVVTRDGYPVEGLSRSDFDLIDNGTHQTPQLAIGTDLPVQVILLFDTSASVAGEQLEQLKSAAHALLETLTDRDCVALVTFSYNARLRTTSCASRDQAGGAIDALATRGTTALYDALYSSLMVADPGEGRAVLLLLSDGDDRASWLTPGEVLRLAKSVDATVYSVSVAPKSATAELVVRAATGNTAQGLGRTLRLRPPGVSFLSDLTGDTGGRVLPVEAGKDLKAAFLAVMSEIRNRYVLSYEPTEVKPGWHKIEVRLRDVPGATVRARSGYFVEP